MRRDQLEHAIRTACQIIERPEAGNPDEQRVLEACDVDVRAGDLEGFHQPGASLHLRLGRGCIGQRLGRRSVAKRRPPLVAVLLRLVGGLGGRRRRRHARRRLHQEGRRSGGCQAVPIWAVRGHGWRRLERHLRGRLRAATASPDTGPKRDDFEGPPECREARVEVLGHWMRALGGRQSSTAAMSSAVLRSRSSAAS
jgi:hypothetical protein